MNFKQKLVYMLIGCLFTLAGYLFASLGNNETPTHTQQNEKQVIDKIVCRELVVVNKDGTPIVNLKSHGKYPSSTGGSLRIYNFQGQETIRLDGSSNGTLSLYNYTGHEVVSLGGRAGGSLSLNDSEGKSATFLVGVGGDIGGFLKFYGERKFLGERKKREVLFNAYQLVMTDGGKYTVHLDGYSTGSLKLYDGEEITVALPR